jgi:hypothetical protein
VSEPQILPSELTRLHDAMTPAIAAAMPQVVYVKDYPVLEEGMPLPALLYAVTNLVPGEDPGDGRVCVLATFEACILVESSRDRAPLQAAVLAGKLVKLLHYQYWGLDFVDHVRDVQAMPTDSIPALDHCSAWSVQWRQPVYLGDTEWLWADEPPGTLVFAFHPDTGPGSESGYIGPGDIG